MKKQFYAFCFLLIGLCVNSRAQLPPTIVNTSIGTPANGVSHYLDISWSIVLGITYYELEVSTDNSNWVSIYTGTDTSYSHNTGSIGNIPHYYRVRTYLNTTPSLWTNASQFPIYSACDIPALPILSNATPNSISLTIAPENPNPNPAYTKYSIYLETVSGYIQPDGSIWLTEVFQTAADWGTVVVTGLSESTNYCFYIKAQNMDGDVRKAPGTTLLATETFANSNNLSTISGLGPTDMFWSPSSCSNGGLVYSANGGCSDGYVGKTGNWTNYFECFLRTPAVNCTGLLSAILSLDLSNSYFSNQADDDRIRFYMLVDGGFRIPESITIDGQQVGYSDINGVWLKFDELRNCSHVEVTFDFVNTTNLSNVIFYMEPHNGFNNSNVFSVKLDNISVRDGATPTSCLATTPCIVPSIDIAPIDAMICEGDDTSFSVTASGSITSYQWQVQIGGSGTFSNLTNTPPYSNVNTSTLYITSPNSGLNNNRYRCVLYHPCSSPIVSSIASLAIVPQNPNLGSISGILQACQGDTLQYTFDPLEATYWDWILPNGWNGNPQSNDIFINVVAGAQSGDIVVSGGNACSTGLSETYSVNITPNSDTTLDVGSCSSYTVPSGNATYTASGTYMDTIPNNMMCDSIITINLTIVQPYPAGIMLNGNTLVASGGLTYNWMDCADSSIVALVGATYTPSASGEYAVISLDGNGCSDTSDCIQVLTVDVSDLSTSSISIYPNPTDGYTTITLTDNYDGGSITLYDMNGRIVKSFTIQDKATQSEIDMGDLSKGMYTLQLVTSGGETGYFKVTKE